MREIQLNTIKVWLINAAELIFWHQIASKGVPYHLLDLFIAYTEQFGVVAPLGEQSTTDEITANKKEYMIAQRTAGPYRPSVLSNQRVKI